MNANLSKSFGRLESGARAISNHDRLRILHDFFRPGEEQYFTFDQTAAIRRGLDFKDLICPDGMRFRAGYFEMGDKVGRVLFLKDYASYIKDSMISALSDFPRNLMLSIDILPIPTDEAVKEIQSRIMGIETDITRWQQRQNDKNNFTATVPYDLEQLRGEAKEFLSDLTERDQRMMFAVVTLVHIADSLEQLDADTDALMSIGREHLCQFSVLRYQQEDGLNTVLPYGLRRVKALRTLTTESTAVLMPFRVQEIQDVGGLSYGVNAISKNLLICDRKRLISPHAFYLGVSGSGKSMAMKSTIQNVALATGDDIIIIDAEREYGPLARALGGEVIEISPNSRHHINPLEVTEDYGDGENPIAMKSEIITSILEQQMGIGRLSGSHKSIIDRCTANVYQDYFNNRGRAPMPLLTDWRNEVMRQADPEAREIALAAELITEGSLRKRPDGRWEGRYTAGRDPVTGKPIYKNVLAKTQKECKVKLERAIEKNGKIDVTKSGQYTVEEWCWIWHENYCKPAVKDSTAEYYRSYIEHHIAPNIGKIKLEKLTTLDLQKFYNKEKKGGRVEKYAGMEDRSLSARTVRGLHAMLRTALDQAVKERLIPYNPAIGCRLPPKEKKEMQILPPEKIGAYLSAAEEHGVLPMFYLELTTGLRRGEITALLWSDLDVKARTLTVSKSAGRLKGEVRVTQPKTANSIRTIILPKETVDLLVQEHAKHPDNPVMFPSPVTGKMYGPDCVGRLHKTLLRKAGITENLRFHDFRHPNVKPKTKISGIFLQ